MNKTIIIIPFHFVWDWPADYLRQTAIHAAKKNTVFCFLGVEQIRLKQICTNKQKVIQRLSSSLLLYRPIQIIPFERFAFVRRINMHLNMCIFQTVIELATRRIDRQRKKILWICNHMYYFFPDYIYGNYTTLYDCVDTISDTETHDTHISEYQENQLIQKSDIMTVISSSLYKQHHKNKHGITIVPQGFRLQSFRRHVSKEKPSSDITIGMVGTLDNRIDYQLLYQLAKRNPTWKFKLYGRNCITDTNKNHSFMLLTKMKNCTVRFALANYIPSIIQNFDIAIIPYDMTYIYNRLCYPMKVMEYFYMGKPIVATPIEELKRFPKFIHIANTVSEWEKSIQTLLKKPWPKNYQKKQQKIAEANSWDKKISTITKLFQ